MVENNLMVCVELNVENWWLVVWGIYLFMLKEWVEFRVCDNYFLDVVYYVSLEVDLVLMLGDFNVICWDLYF